MGSSARPGSPLIACFSLVLNLPAIASEPPDGISTVVFGATVRIDGWSRWRAARPGDGQRVFA